MGEWLDGYCLECMVCRNILEDLRRGEWNSVLPMYSSVNATAFRNAGA
jgi:hypothetical protein